MLTRFVLWTCKAATADKYLLLGFIVFIAGLVLIGIGYSQGGL